MTKHSFFIGMISFMFLALTAVADDTATPDNPLYIAWSKVAVGSSASYAGDIETPDGKKLHFTGVLTLKELTTASAKLEHASKFADAEQPAESLIIPAKGKPGDVTKKQSVKIHAMDKDFQCDVYEINFALAGAPETDKPDAHTTATVYISPDVPGGVVKMTVNPPSGKSFDVLVESTKAK